MSSKLYDCLIIGGGPAGLSAATTIARQATTALILDSGEYRNARSKHMHTVPGFDHQDPAIWRKKARDDLQARYAEFIDFKPAKITTVRKTDDKVFEVADESGSIYKGSKLVLATGSKDVFDGQAEGFEECWARGIFHCLFCHGFEERGAESMGVLATENLANPKMIQHIVPMAKRLAKSVTIYTDGDDALAKTCPTLYRSTKIHVDNRKIASYALLEGGPRVQINFSNGESKVEGFCVSGPRLVQTAGELTSQLGLEMVDGGVNVKVEGPFGQTNVEGCFAGGDCSTMMKSALNAISLGGFAGVGALTELGHELDAKDEL